ncbi:MAG: DUF3854 domain-containing protein [Hassallia sp. WJT32-NPBG1]|jgi:DNA polymerase I-like protein with 3'-5' exonuclease and polymerase domains|nr:DUF3854 domain-containing protein [Hassallia sp. WJT32-NPBG1]
MIVFKSLINFMLSHNHAFSQEIKNSAIKNNTTFVGICIIADHHRDTLQASGIANDIIDDNYRTLDSTQTEKYLANNIKTPYDRRLYADVLKGGGLLGCESCFKADLPLKNTKGTRYLNPVGVPKKPLQLKISQQRWDAIARNYGVTPKLPDEDGHTWALKNLIPLYVVEGLKKTAALMSALPILAIAIEGHTLSCLKDKSDVAFAEFLHPDREVVLLYDQDYKVEARRGTEASIERVIKHIYTPATKDEDEILRCQLKIGFWLSHKGIDDLLVAEGIESVEKVLKTATPCQNWVKSADHILGYKPDVTFNAPQFIKVEPPIEALLVAILGAKGTGKTWLLDQITTKAKSEGRAVILINPLIQLAVSNAKRLGLEYIRDLVEKAYEAKYVSLVINSIYKLIELENPKTLDRFKGSLIVIDEATQVLNNLVLSPTCFKERSKLLKTLKLLCETISSSCGQLILSDADLDHNTVKFFSSLLGNVDPYVIENTYREKGYTAYVSNSEKPVDLIATAITQTNNGKHVLVHLTGQKQNSPWGTFNIEALLNQYCDPSFLIIRNDSKTTMETGHPAFRSTSNIHAVCDACDVLVTSPVMQTGVSIEDRDLTKPLDEQKGLVRPFDLVIGIFTGTGSPDSVRQTLMRYRNLDCFRLIWVADRGMPGEFARYGKTPSSVALQSAKLLDETDRVLSQTSIQWKYDYPDFKPNLSPAEYFANRVAVQNSEIFEYRKRVLFDLSVKEGNKLIHIEDASEIFPYEFDCDELLAGIKEQKTTATQERDTRLAQVKPAETITDEDYKQLKEATELTREEQDQLESKVISKRYGDVELTEELSAKDRDGFFTQAALVYRLTIGRDVTKQLSQLRGYRTLKRDKGQPIAHDFIDSNLTTLKAEFVSDSGFFSLIGNSVHKYDPETLKVHQYLLDNRERYRLTFGNVTSSKLKEDWTIQAFTPLIEAVGATKGDVEKITVDGTRCNSYLLFFGITTQELFDSIFPNWLARDVEKAENWTKRLRDIEIEKLISLCPADVDLKYFEQFKQTELFGDAWEHINTDTRIQIINRVDNFQLPTPIKQQIDPDATDYQAILDEIAGWDTISVDIESFGKDPKNKEGLHARKGFIRLFQISNGYKVYYVDLGGRDDNRELIGSKLQAFISLLKQKVADKNTKIIGQNIHFDLRFLTFQLDFPKATNVIDTMLGAKIFFGNYGALKQPPTLPGGYGLGNLGAKFLGLKVNKAEQKSDWGAQLTQSQIDYAVYDPFITYWLYQRELEVYENPGKFGFGKLAQDGLMDAWKLENDVISCAVELEKNGLPFDRQLAENNLVKCKNEQTKLLKHWALLIPKIKNNQILFWLYQHLLSICELPDELTLDKKLKGNLESLLVDWASLLSPAFQYTQNKILKVHLNVKYSLGIKKLDKTALADLAEYDEVKLLGKLRAIKIPIQQLESLLRSAEKTGRVQTTFNTLTGTGRFSSGNSKIFNDLPNLQSISAKDNPALKAYGLEGVRACVTNDISSNFKHWIINQKAAKKQLANYEKLWQNNPEHRDYIEVALSYLTRLVATNSCKILYLGNDFDWVDNKTFIKLFKDKNPQLENIARKITDKGIIIVDLAASHGRIAADVADDETAIAGCNDDNIDNHSKVGVYIAKALGDDITWEEIAKNKKEMPYKLYRDAAKNTYYGWLNGAGPKRVQEQIKANSGQIVSIEACQAAIKGCEALYPNVVNFRKTMIEELSNPANLLHIDGNYYAVNKMKSVNNRITHPVTVDDTTVDLPYTKCLAAIWSRTEATALKRALIKIVDLSDEKPEWELKAINYVHDEINIEFNSDYAEEVATTVNDIIGDCFAETLDKVSDGRESNWTKLVVNNWSEK